MPKRLDLVGRQFSKLNVRRFAQMKGGKSYWLARCECGTYVLAQGTSLIRGTVASCGCTMSHMKQPGPKVPRDFTHDGYYTGADGKQHRTRMYRLWEGIKSRCFNASSRDYPQWGGRGITMHEPWRLSYVTFRDDILRLLGPCPDGMSCDRIDNDKSYVPGNLRWATHSEQQRNRRPFKWKKTRKNFSTKLTPAA